jgi:arginyl-tRNA synthetase
VTLSEEDRARPYIEMSGRRGIGVKAEDLLASLASTSGVEIEKRMAEATGVRADAPPALDASARALIAAQIAVGALRYYMLRFTKNRVVAFDVEDSLAFEGETGPYLQYAAVRSRNIFHKLGEREGFTRAGAVAIIDRARFDVLDAEDAIEHWKIVREIARLPEIVQQAVDALELSTLARFAFSVSQMFSTFYHRYSILGETDPARRELRVALNELYLRFMETCFALMGIPLPERM